MKIPNNILKKVSFLKKIFLSIFVILCLFSPTIFVFAVETNSEEPSYTVGKTWTHNGVTYEIRNYPNGEAEAVAISTQTGPIYFANGSSTTTNGQFSTTSVGMIEEESTPLPYPTTTPSKATTASSTLSDDFFDCTIGGILARAISSAITELITKAIATVFTGIFGSKVKITNPQDDAKDKGVSLDLLGLSIPIVPSWDSFAYCLANRTIAYISEATKQWIRGGFKGNPAFVDDPAGFFSQVADFEYETFLNDVVGDLLCEPFRIQVISTLHKNYNKVYMGEGGYGRCTLGDGDNVDAFLAGEYFDFDIWMDYTQNPANNPLGSYLLAEEELTSRISVAQNTAKIELDWGDGYFSWKDEKTGKTLTPGKVIETELSTRLGVDEQRLILADEFDEVVAELVNYLIKAALDEVLNIGGSE